MYASIDLFYNGFILENYKVKSNNKRTSFLAFCF